MLNWPDDPRNVSGNFAKNILKNQPLADGLEESLSLCGSLLLYFLNPFHILTISILGHDAILYFYYNLSFETFT